MEQVYIGIDPAFREKGIGFCMLEGSVVTFKKYSINELLNSIANNELVNAIVCVENSNIQSTTFSTYHYEKLVKSKKYTIKSALSLCQRQSRDVGKNMATSEIICRMLDFRCKKLVEVSPKEKGNKWEKGDIVFRCIDRNKWSSNKKKLNQDDRDSFKLMLIGRK